MRVSAHSEAGFLVLSTWKAEVCVATVRLLPAEAAELVAGVTAELASLAVPPAGALDEDVEVRLSRVEAALDELRSQDS
ncbi:MAG TPA: hypothetical protein VNU26_14880 [Mycobacteriales bacterium]|nr:hypothetical protein [Mycobacteriales bacterium]